MKQMSSAVFQTLKFECVENSALVKVLLAAGTKQKPTMQPSSQSVVIKSTLKYISW